MSDDLSALLASLQRRRGDGKGAVSGGTNWIDHVLEDQPEQRLSSLKAQLRAGLGVDGLRAIIMQAFPDPSDATAVIRTLLADEELLETLAGLREELEHLLVELAGTQAAAGRATRAGVNSAIQAKLAARRMRVRPKALRKTYRDFLDEADEPIPQYLEWIETYGFDRRHEVVQFVEQALAADMYSLDPSCSRIEFGNLIDWIRRLTSVRSSDNLVIRLCWEEALMSRLGLQREDLVVGMLRVLQGGTDIQDLIIGVFGGIRFALDRQAKVEFAHRLRRAMAALPHAAWVDPAFEQKAREDIDEMIGRAVTHEASPRNEWGRA